MIGLILICHGDLAEALLRTAEEIAGPIEGVCCISNHGKSPAVVREETERALARFDGGDGVLIMADLFGSSCWRCGFEELVVRPNDRDRIAVIAGVNLGMLLSFSQKRKTLGFRELAATLVEDGRRGISGSTFSSDSSEVRR